MTKPINPRWRHPVATIVCFYLMMIAQLGLAIVDGVELGNEIAEREGLVQLWYAFVLVTGSITWPNSQVAEYYEAPFCVPTLSGPGPGAAVSPSPTSLFSRTTRDNTRAMGIPVAVAYSART